jgi:two-component system, OmpR family, sensor histidine kinase QseC
MSLPASLQGRLIFGSIAVLLVCGLVAGFGGYRSAQHEADELFDAQLAQVGQTLLTLARAGDDDIAEELGKSGHHYQTRLVFQVWHGDKHGVAPHLLLRSPGVGPKALPASGEGFSNARLQDGAYRFYATSDRHSEVHVVVGQSLAIRQELVRGIAWNNAWPFLLVLPIWALAIAWLVNHTLAPVRGLAADVSARGADNLAPVLGRDVPEELRPLLESLNDLIGRLATAMENERRFTGDAAHELRTPIAALRAQLDALRLSPDAAGRDGAIGKAREALDRMARLVTQLLTLARLEGVAMPQGEALDLAELARDVCGEWADKAVARNIDLSLAAVATPCQGEPEGLRILLRNLLDNALRYTPPDGRVEVVVSAATQESGPVLRVADSGPGIPPERRHELGRRFHRLQCVGPDGVGLGLSIVLRIAERHAALVEFGAGLDGRGLGVEIRFPV